MIFILSKSVSFSRTERVCTSLSKHQKHIICTIYKAKTRCSSFPPYVVMKHNFVFCALSRPNSFQVGPYRQSERGDIYKEMADKLVETGWAYPCFCTEEELIAKREQVMAHLSRLDLQLWLEGLLCVFPTLVSATCHLLLLCTSGLRGVERVFWLLTPEWVFRRRCLSTTMFRSQCLTAFRPRTKTKPPSTMAHGGTLTLRR